MAKNELLENILDDLSVIKDKDASRDKRLESIESALKELVDNVESGKSVPSTAKVEPKSTIPYDILKDAVYDGMAEYFKAEPNHTGILSEDNILKIHSVINKVDSKWVKEHWDKEDEKAKAEHDLLVSQRTAQGIHTIPMVAEWAPEYSPEIQRVMRFVGLKTLPEDEPAETAHAILKVWGDAISRITAPPPPEPPSLRAWLRYKWQQTKAYFQNRQTLAYTLLYIGGLTIVVCISLYQSAVMDLDRTNRIFYHNVIRNKNGADDYHELDSLIHSNSFYRTYRTLDK